MYHRLLFMGFLAFCVGSQVQAQDQKISRDSLRNIQDSLNVIADSVMTYRDSVRVVQDSLRVIQDSIRVIQDSIRTEKDSLRYQAFEKLSQKSKFTRLLHRFVFKPVTPEVAQKPKASKSRILKSLRKTEGKIIRDIHIITLDPFGYHIRDTAIVPHGVFMKAGNTLHVKTQPAIIRNLLLFKKNEPYDSLLVKESERLIRSQKFVRDVLVYTLPATRKNDSIDVYIRVLDVWSIIPAFGMSQSTVEMGLTDQNFTGLGNSFQIDMQLNRPTRDSITRISYFIPNIRSSYISFNLQYSFVNVDEMVNSQEFRRTAYSPLSSNLRYLYSGNNGIVRSLEINRTFYSPVAKWAGGIFLGQMITAQNYILQDTFQYLSSRTNIQDYWTARSWQLFKKQYADARTTRLILSGRLLRIRYPGKPPEATQLNVFNNENIYFAGIGYSSRKYVQDRYIFNYGRVEDVPAGRAFGLTLGLDVQQKTKWYLGLKAAWGNYYRFGYLSTQLEYGTLLGHRGADQGVITARINYFTRLLDFGNWKIRQFIAPVLIVGINRLPTDNLTFSEGMKGFEGLKYAANQMVVLTLQTQSYAPWNLLGFHFGPYFFCTLGMLGNESSNLTHSRLYSLLGLGMLIKNDYLNFNTFQISLTFYPFIPDKGYNILKTNAYKTSDYGFRDFELSKPAVVDYR